MTQPVCSQPKGATPQGLCDMAGNVWEWVADPWHPSYEGARDDGGVWTSGGQADRVYRGGSWEEDARLQRTTNRGFGSPSLQLGGVGFRPILGGP